MEKKYCPKIIVIIIWPEESHNAEFLMWLYSNYLIRLSEMECVGTESTEIPSYTDWEYSPVPHLIDTTFLGAGVIVISLVSLGGFLYSRKYSRQNPILKEDLEALSQDVEGFDENTLLEFKRAAYMAKGVGFLARGLFWAAEKGAKISPLHNKFPISIYQAAAEEASSLTAEKIVLVI
ncbi:MAG: hypothetical protein JSW11_22305 [Candidatus Heimdallarchaeota archaeon]|nr:MAG: hypothetical protein JSW11_22305 [Candidatus Heimdallarchaeota archaeon]